MEDSFVNDILLTAEILKHDPLDTEFTPNVSVTAEPVNIAAERTEDGVVLILTDVRGTTRVLIRDGERGGDGAQGPAGRDGYTPIKGIDYFDGKDGKDGTMSFEELTPDQKESLRGEQGPKGNDGYTPIKGIDYFDGMDGKDGRDGTDGQDGYTPRKGIDYRDGVDGYTPVKGVDYFDGKDGKDGVNGADGKTPVKGEDYFTPDDIANVKDSFRLTFTNKSVSTSAWAADTTYADYPYRAAVACYGVTVSHIPFVNLNTAEAVSGEFSPVSQSYAGGVYIYAASIPTDVITIPSIVCII